MVLKPYTQPHSLPTRRTARIGGDGYGCPRPHGEIHRGFILFGSPAGAGPFADWLTDPGAPPGSTDPESEQVDGTRRSAAGMCWGGGRGDGYGADVPEEVRGRRRRTARIRCPKAPPEGNGGRAPYRTCPAGRPWNGGARGAQYAGLAKPGPLGARIVARLRGGDPR